MTKKEVFAIADAQGLRAASLPESQDLCFIQAGRADFLFSAKDLTPGPIIDRQGHILGKHRGLPCYTVGQRRSLGVTAKRPLYVIAIDQTRNALIVGQEEDLYASNLVARERHFLSGEAIRAGSRVDAKIRYRSPASACTLCPLDNERFSIHFDEPQRAISPGQIVAIYDGARLLGGGIIE
jgi:tRNA-specific 2-thiouridylase